MAELLQCFEDLFTVVLDRFLLAFLLPLAPAGRRNFFLHFHRFLFPQVVKNSNFQFRSSHVTSNRSGSNGCRSSRLNKLPTGQVVHRECGCVDGELREVLGLATNVDPQIKIFHTLANGFYQSLYDRALHAATSKRPCRRLACDADSTFPARVARPCAAWAKR